MTQERKPFFRIRLTHVSGGNSCNTLPLTENGQCSIEVMATKEPTVAYRNLHYEALGGPRGGQRFYLEFEAAGPTPGSVILGVLDCELDLMKKLIAQDAAMRPMEG